MKKTYFLSDAHLGMYPAIKSIEREKILVKWMDYIKPDVDELYLLGDIFDFWYEYKRVIPKGFSRFLGKLTEFSDHGIPVYFFTGNHDVWCFDYLEKECGVKLVKKPLVKKIGGKRFYMAHGDGLGPGDKSYLLLKWAFHNKFLQWMFSRLHPNFAMALGQKWSKNSRLSKGIYAKFQGVNEWLIQHALKILEKEHVDYFVFGHRHLPVDLMLNEKAKIVILGDWIVHFTYAEFDGENLLLKQFAENKGHVIITSLDT